MVVPFEGLAIRNAMSTIISIIFNGLTADAADQDLKAFWLTKRVMRYSGLKRPQSMRDIYPDAVRAKPPPRYLEKEVGR